MSRWLLKPKPMPFRNLTLPQLEKSLTSWSLDVWKTTSKKPLGKKWRLQPKRQQHNQLHKKQLLVADKWTCLPQAVAQLLRLKAIAKKTWVTPPTTTNMSILRWGEAYCWSNCSNKNRFVLIPKPPASMPWKRNWWASPFLGKWEQVTTWACLKIKTKRRRL